jgi:CDP-diacylglycerol--glycerol-3-phosphate 3-phosphatidyltransferase
MNPAIALTLLRPAIAPFFAFAFIRGFDGGSTPWLWAALALLVVGEVSDALDGHIARKRKQVTDFGRICDPMADSLYRLTAILTFMVVGIIPMWMFLVFFYRDTFLSLARTMCAAKGTVLAARMSGKLKAVFQAIAIVGTVLVALLHAYGLSLVPRTILGFHPGFWLTVPAVLIAVISVPDYVVPNWGAIRSAMKTR